MAGTIRHEKMYHVECPNCGDSEEDEGTYRSFERSIKKEGWKKINGGWVCTNCVEERKNK